MDNQQIKKFMAENWKKHGIPENAGRIGAASGGFHGRFADVKSGALRDTFAKFNNFNTNKSQNGVGQMPQGAMSFQAIPEPKVGKDRRPINKDAIEKFTGKKHEVENFQPVKKEATGELAMIQNLFGGSGRAKSLDVYGGGMQQQPQYNQLQYPQTEELNLDQIYAQKGGFDPMQMIINKRNEAPQQQQIAGYDSFQEKQMQPMGYNPNMPMDMQMQLMQAQYGQYQPRQESEYMQYSVAANQMSPQEQMAEIARNMTIEVLSEYKKQEKKNQILTRVKHTIHDNLVRDYNGKHYLMEVNKNGYLVLKPAKLKSKD